MLALITTTINLPGVLNLYRASDPFVRFFVAGDVRTPVDPCKLIENCRYISPDEQGRWKCSELLGWNTITRRNIALLEALEWGADLIVTIDDDNLPLESSTYFFDFQTLFDRPFNGLTVGGGWFDAGRWGFPLRGSVVQRGFPQEMQSDAPVSGIINAKIGLAQGIILGDPDTSAVDRMSQHPCVHTVSELLRAGFVVDNYTWTVCNTQNTAVLREFAPALFCVPQFGRYDDIFASLVCRRIMREKGYHTHFGKPFVWQHRNPHNLVNDLRAELFGMTNILKLATLLSSLDLKGAEPMAVIYYEIQKQDWCPEGVEELVSAWMMDVESVL